MADPADTGEPEDADERQWRGLGPRGDRKPSTYDRTVGTWVRYNREALGTARVPVADELTRRHPDEPWQEQRLARLENAIQRVTLTDLLNVLEALGVPPRLFFQQAGIVPAGGGVEEAINGAPELSGYERLNLAREYRRAAERSAHSAGPPEPPVD